MGEIYSHLNDAERATLMLMLSNGHSQAAIARTLKRSASTISRERRRQRDLGALPDEASRAGAHAYLGSE